MNLRAKAREIVAQMILEEKSSLCSGKDYWYLKLIDRLGLPSIMVTDGPHGVRKQLSSSEDLGISENVPAVCFPTAVSMACSFDPALLREVGQSLAEECLQEGVSVLLGPGMNIKRSPLCGRNFEYYSEDPYLSGHLAAAFIEGVQSKGVGTSLKHFAANNQETRRLTVDAVMDQRTLREIYLSGFEYAIKQARPWTVMCSYNRLFGEFVSQNEYLLTQILRQEWGYEGLVISDWGAVVDRVKGVAAGLDLEMPHLDRTHDERVAQAVIAGDLPVALLNQTAENVTALLLRARGQKRAQYNVSAHRALARRAAAESAVLLKNEGNLLPLNPSSSVALIGAFAKNPRYQGSGSSRITPIRVNDAVEELKSLGLRFEYAAGYFEDADAPDEGLLAEACQVAAGKDVVLLFVGLPDRFESETFDRETLALPQSHERLIEAVSEVNHNVVVVLYCGGVVEMPWADRVKSILLMHLGGETVNGAVADLLLGRVNPSGKLAETWPFQLEDNPSFNYFPGYPLTVEYREGIFVGYRYYDSAHVPVRFPFGFGLSYTTFSLSDLQLSSNKMGDSDTLKVTCRVSNTGSRAGSEVVQLYIAKKGSVIIRAEQELKGFIKARLSPGESQQVEFTLFQRDFAYYNVNLADWHVEEGEYEVRIGTSSRDIQLKAVLTCTTRVKAALPDLRAQAPGYYHPSARWTVSDADFSTILGRSIPARERVKGAPHTVNSTITDIQDKWFGRLIRHLINQQVTKIGAKDPYLKMMAEKIVNDMPLRFLTMMGSDSMSILQVEGLVDVLNGHFLKGIKKLRKIAK